VCIRAYLKLAHICALARRGDPIKAIAEAAHGALLFAEDQSVPASALYFGSTVEASIIELQSR
jgi:hypothetical protein